MAVLYPPIIEGTIPAFYGDEIIVPYSMNRTVSKGDFKGFALKIKTVQNNIHIGTVTTEAYSDIEAMFNVSGLKLKQGQHYKVQLAYLDITGEIGHYSTVGVIKYTNRPSVYIEDMEAGAYNQHRFLYVGRYNQGPLGDYNEKVSSYRFIIYDTDNNIIQDTGELVHNSLQDKESYSSFDEFEFTRELTDGEVCKIQYQVITNNGLRLSSPRYSFIKGFVVEADLDAMLLVENDNDNAFVELTMRGVSTNGSYVYHDDSEEKTISGTFIVSRRKVDEPGKWRELTRFALNAQRPSEWVWRDYTAEQGISYVYSIQQYNDKLYSKRITSKIYDENIKDWVDYVVSVDFEDAFLFDGERQLKIKYNPKVSSFKTTMQESKVDTIGSKYPFIFRSGHVSYKEFPISGLISYLMDEANLFMIDEGFAPDKKSQENYNKLYRSSTKETSGQEVKAHDFVSSTNLSSDNIRKERNFKLAVLDWLNNGKPKLFRSPTEGNYIVRLMNCSLSPNDTLGRMLHTFSCTAYEIADYNISNLLNMGLMSASAITPDQMVEYWATKELLPILLTPSNGEWTSNILPTDRMPTTLKFEGLCAGDKIKISFSDREQIILIGSTGTYTIKDVAPIKSTQLNCRNAKVNGILTYNYQEKVENEFSLYRNAYNKEVPIRQLFGADHKDTNMIEYIGDIKTKILQLHYIQIEKRPLDKVYCDANQNIYLDKYLTIPFSKEVADPLTIYQVHSTPLNGEAKYNTGYVYDWNYNTELDRESGEYTLTFEDKFPPIKPLKFFDGRTLQELNEYSTSFILDGSEVELRERGIFKAADINPTSLTLGSGLILTIGYSSSIFEYNFENNKEYNNLLNEYDNIVQEYIKGIISYDEAVMTLNLQRAKIKISYDALLAKIEQYIKDNNINV